MKKFIYIILALLLSLPSVDLGAKGKRTYVIGFYNLENLFDTEPQILTDASITGDLRWQAKQIGWIIKNV